MMNFGKVLVYLKAILIEFWILFHMNYNLNKILDVLFVLKNLYLHKCFLALRMLCKAKKRLCKHMLSYICLNSFSAEGITSFGLFICSVGKRENHMSFSKLWSLPTLSRTPFSLIIFILRLIMGRNTINLLHGIHTIWLL